MSKEERKALYREQERLLLEMEKKGEQIGKLYRHQRQVKRVQKEAKTQKGRGDKERRATTAAPRGHPAAQLKPRPGELSSRNLGLLRDLKAVQASLKT
ncbi:centrosomal protein of 57 kDa-like [Thalassophryne amazonica]|uniref:centrosomal protein of 57 kDa-like n=1 Tax=Thalassophryne amazonica TaxID=390379 RepID=UPI001470BF7B|nr:centrosomal protein of 57 kDa-like [Thalassophryne amazonica]